MKKVSTAQLPGSRKRSVAFVSALAAVALMAAALLVALPRNPSVVHAHAGVTASAQPAGTAEPRTETPAPSTPLPPSASPWAGSRVSPTAVSASASPAPKASPAKAVKPDKAVIIFTFDDGALSDYLLAYPILKKYGIKGTSYLVTKFMDENMKGRLTWGEVKEMSKYGWVFGCHTYDHRRLSSMSDAEIRRTMELVNKSFTKQGFQPPQIMAYPYGGHNKRVIDVVRQYRKQARAYTDARFVDLKHPTPYEIPCVKANMRTEDQLNRLEKLVDRACKQKAVVVFCLHVLYKDKPCDTVKPNHKVLSGSAPQTSSKLFAELVRYCVNKDCAFMDMKQLMDFYP